MSQEGHTWLRTDFRFPFFLFLFKFADEPAGSFMFDRTDSAPGFDAAFYAGEQKHIDMIRGYMYYSVLQCVAVCCSLLQCVAVCCSALHE